MILGVKGLKKLNLINTLFPGITDQGLYRIVGVGSKVQNLLLQCIDKKKVASIDLEDEDCEWEVKTITSALKQYLRYGADAVSLCLTLSRPRVPYGTRRNYELSIWSICVKFAQPKDL